MSGARGNLTAQAHRPDLSPFLMKAIGPRRGWNRVPNSVGGPSGCPPTHWPSGTRATHARTRAKPVRPRERAPARLCRPAFFLHTQSATTSCLTLNQSLRSTKNSPRGRMGKSFERWPYLPIDFQILRKGAGSDVRCSHSGTRGGRGVGLRRWGSLARRR